MANLNFYTIATSKYSIFILPYIMSALWSNPDSTVEILTDNVGVVTPNVKAFLDDYFKGKWLIKKVPKKFNSWFTRGKKIKSIRWITQPEIKSDYTYIGDIDIPTLESGIARMHSKHASFIKRTYSNIVRNHPTKNKITGLHFVCTQPYYKKLTAKACAPIIKQITNNSWPIALLDECLLYILIKKFVGLPPKEVYANRGKLAWERVTYRPVHGIHMSYGRKLKGWGVGEKWMDRIRLFKSTNIWKDGYKLVPKAFLQKFSDKTLQKALAAHKVK